MCHHLLCSALTGGADSVSGSGPALLCPGMSEWAFFRSFWRCFDCPAYVQTAHVCCRTCWALRLTAMFWPLLNLKNQVCFPLPVLHICLSDFMNWFMLPSKFAVMDNIWCHWLTESDLQVCVSKNLTCCTKKMEEKYQLAARRDIQNLLQTSSSGIKLIISRDVAAFQGKQPPLERLLRNVYSTVWRRLPALRLFLSPGLFLARSTVIMQTCRRAGLLACCPPKHTIYRMITVISLRFAQTKPKVGPR